MAGTARTWTAANLASASSPDEVRHALADAAAQLGDQPVPAATVLALLEKLALETARVRAELEAPTRAREVLFASVAHDLRNPLNTFAMSAGLLRDDLEGPDFDRTRALSLVARMDRATARMQSLIEDLLAASRVESGSIELARQPVAAAAVARAALAKAKPLCSEKGAVAEEGAIDETAMVDVDAAHTSHALLKLIAVALKTIGDGGTIRVGVERHAADVLFTIRAGTPRGSVAIPANEEGRGGLAYLIGRGIVAMQDGRLQTESTQEGPRLVVVFPAKS